MSAEILHVSVQISFVYVKLCKVWLYRGFCSDIHNYVYNEQKSTQQKHLEIKLIMNPVELQSTV